MDLVATFGSSQDPGLSFIPVETRAQALSWAGNSVLKAFLPSLTLSVLSILSLLWEALAKFQDDFCPHTLLP